jgi:hypothetical protein
MGGDGGGVGLREVCKQLFYICLRCMRCVRLPALHACFTSTQKMYVSVCKTVTVLSLATTSVDDQTSLIYYTFFKTKCNFRFY